MPHIRLLQIFAPLLQLLVLVACGSCVSTASSYTQDRRALPLAFGAVAGTLVGLIGIAIHWGFMWLLHHCSPGFTNADCANITAALAFWLLPGVGLYLGIHAIP